MMMTTPFKGLFNLGIVLLLIFPFYTIVDGESTCSCNRDDLNCSTTLEECETVCGTSDNTTFSDFATSGSGVESGSVYRTQSCICGPFDPSQEFCNDCDFCEQRTNVWSLSDYSSSCAAVGLDKQALCRLFCSDIDPLAFEFFGPGDDAYCKCAGVLVCGSGGTTIGGNSNALFLSLISSLLFWFFLL